MMERLEEKPKAMVPAVDVDGLANNLSDRNGMDLVDEKMYVRELFAQEIATVRDRILYDRNDFLTVFISGQMGAGKTTALTFLADSEVKVTFFPIHVKPTMSIDLAKIDDEDVNVVDVLMNIGEVLFKIARDFKKDAFILNHREQFEQIEKSVNDKLQITEFKEGRTPEEWGLALVKFFTGFNSEKLYRKEVRETFKYRTYDLQQYLDRMIFDFEEIVIPGKRALLIIDDWEKLRNAKGLQNVFENGMPDLMRLRCKKIIPIPVHLQALRIGRDIYRNAIYFALKILPNPHANETHEEAGEESIFIANNRALLKEIVMRRIDVSRQQDLFDQGVLDRAVEMSGGIVRQFLVIVYEAATAARMRGSSQKVRMEHLEDAIHTMRRGISVEVVFDGELVNSLNHIREHFLPPADSNREKLVEAFVNLYIICNMNGDPCFHLNPLLIDTIRKNASNTSRTT